MKKTFIRLLSILVFALIAFAGFCYYRGPDGVSLLNRLKQGFSNIIENRHCEEDGKPCQIMQEPVEIEEEQKDIAEQDGDCVLEQLENIQAIKIDNVVKNCVSKEKIGVVPDGLGGACFPEYFIIDGKFVTRDMCSRGSQPDIVCSRKVEGDYYEYFTNVSLDALEFISSGNNSNINPYSLILGKGLLNHIVNNPYGNRIYFLHGDENFKGFSNALLGWTDGKNYFVAGHRRNEMGEIYDKTPLYFVINDTLYEAGEREFAGIKNDTVTVQRISNLVENTETMKSTFTLETCEVDLM